MATRSLAHYGSHALGTARSVGRDVFGRFRVGARRAGGAIVSRSAAASAALSRAQEKDTLGGVMARSVGPGVVALGAGALDGSAVGSWVNEKTGGWLDASTALGLLGGVARGLKVDRWVHPGLARANSTMLAGIIPVWLYKRGLGLPGIVSGRMGSSGSPQISGTAEAAKQSPKLEASEPIPGESTVS